MDALSSVEANESKKHKSKRKKTMDGYHMGTSASPMLLLRRRIVLPSIIVLEEDAVGRRGPPATLACTGPDP